MDDQLDADTVIEGKEGAATVNQESVISRIILRLARGNIIFQIKHMRTTNIKRKTLDINPPRFLQSSTSTKFISFQHIPPDTPSQTSQLLIPNNILQPEINLYQWRLKTELPIVKIISYQVLESQTDRALLQVDLESFPIRLADLKDLPLFKILYLLKESIIGFERLYAKMGAFVISPKMIALSQTNKCKIWCNQDFSSNKPERTFFSQIEFLRSIFSLFEERANKLKNTNLFFIEIRKLQTFCSTLSFIQNYARQNKISIANSCKINPNEKISFEPSRGFDPSLTMGRAPTFLNNSLSISLSSRSKGLILDEIKKQCQLQQPSFQNKQKNAQLKASGDTAADLYGSKTESILNTQDELVSSLMINDKDFKDQENKIKGSLPTIAEKRSLFTRKYSEKQGQFNIQCLTPSYATKKWQDESHHFGWNDNQFLGDDSEEEADPEKIKNLFSTNNWKVAIKGLFGAEEALKKSFHNGKETRKTELDHSKLHLLDGLGKNMLESNIHEEYEL